MQAPRLGQLTTVAGTSVVFVGAPVGLALLSTIWRGTLGSQRAGLERAR